MAGRRCVHDHEVIWRGAARLSLELRQLPHLAHAEQLPHAGRGHRKRVEQLARAEHLPERPGLDRQVLLHRRLGVNRDRVQVARQLELREALALLREGPLDVLLAGQLGDDRAQSLACREQSERGRDGRLADPALAGDEQQPVIQGPWHDR